jgi:ABC-2 type transport system permease protein
VSAAVTSKGPSVTGGFWASLVAVMQKEFVHLRRDRGALFLVFFIPLVQLTLYGAIDQTVKDLPTVVVDHDRSRFSRELMDELRATKTFKVTLVTSNADEARSAIAAGRVRVGIEIPPDFHDKRARGTGANILALIDGSDSTVSAQALAAVNGIALTKNLEAAEGRGVTGSDKVEPALVAHPVILFNPSGRTANYIIPGLVAVILQLIGIVQTAIAIVREREKGTLEQLLVTPIDPLGLMLGKVVPYLFVGVGEVMLILVAMRFGFGVPIRGSIVFLFAMCIIYLFALLSLGLYISTVAKTQQSAQGMAQLFFLPAIFLSGYIFPAAGLPWPLYWLGRLMPVTHMIEVMRGVVLRQATPLELMPSVLSLVAMSLVLMTLTVRRFRKVSLA